MFRYVKCETTKLTCDQRGWNIEMRNIPLRSKLTASSTI